jgi:hypothetical protein
MEDANNRHIDFCGGASDWNGIVKNEIATGVGVREDYSVRVDRRNDVCPRGEILA